MMSNNESTLRRIIWLFPDRESTRTQAKWSGAFWETYAQIANDMGLSFKRVAPEAVVVDALNPQDPKFYIDGERVTPHDTVFISTPYTLPYQTVDAFNQFTLYAVLEEAGFYLPHPTDMAAVGNDKLATLLRFRDCPVPPVPTVRIGTGRDLLYDEYEVAIEDLPYPAFTKPAGWCASRGINLARDAHDVRGLLSLAQGGDTTMVLQPFLGDNTADYRVFMIDGKPHTVMVRASGDGAIYPQFTTGATMWFCPLPEELSEAMSWIAKKLPVPFACVDFLHDGEKFWFSEIEMDGGILCPDPSDPQAVATQHSIIRDRFEAYRTRHHAFLQEVKA